MACIIGVLCSVSCRNGVCCELQERIGVPGCLFVGGASVGAKVGVQGAYCVVQELPELHCRVSGSDKVVEEGA